MGVPAQPEREKEDRGNVTQRDGGYEEKGEEEIATVQSHFTDLVRFFFLCASLVMFSHIRTACEIGLGSVRGKLSARL